MRVLRGKTALERGTEQVGLALAFLGHTCIWELLKAQLARGLS